MGDRIGLELKGVLKGFMEVELALDGKFQTSGRISLSFAHFLSSFLYLSQIHTVPSVISFPAID